MTRVKKIAPKLFYLLSLVLIGVSIFGSRGLIQLRSLHRETLGLEQKSRQLESEVQVLKAEVESIQNDPVALERRVRAELGLSRPNEILYIEKQRPE